MSFAMSAAAASLAAATALGGADVSAVFQQALFQPAGTRGAGAVTYDKAAVPEFSRAAVQQQAGGERGGTRIKLKVHGLQANRDFGAHVHTKPCGAKPDDSGPHYQHRADPAAGPDKPSTDPAYANSRNEAWLDFTTDKHGDGAGDSSVRWRFRSGEARSVVLHAHKTHTGAGHAGDAGDRLACVNVPFRR